jgi:hypothetical protein
MNTFMVLLPFLVALAYIYYRYSLPRVTCPDCGETLPLLYSPFKKTPRMWRAGGCLCAQCGCETTLAGQKVTADTPAEPFPKAQLAMLSIALLLGVVELGAIAFMSRPVVAPLMVAAPQTVPQAVPAMVPVMVLPVGS